MKRPIAVVLSAILLGLFAGFQLLSTAVTAIIGFLAMAKKLPVSAAAGSVSPSFQPGLFLGTSLMLAAFAVWFILTLIALLSMRSWARYSVLVIGGLMAGFGGIAAVTSFAMPFLMHGLPSAPNQIQSPGEMRMVFFTAGVIYGIISGLGVALLVYFNLAKTRALFLLGEPVVTGPPNTSTGRPRPTAVTVIGWFYLISGAFCLLYIPLPFPTFLFGFVLHGWGAHLVYAALGLLTLAIGYGLLRLRNAARLAVFGLFILCPIQIAVLLTPWGMRQFRTYMDAFSTAMSGGPSAINPFLSPGSLIFFLLLGFVGSGLILWLLHRHREAFTQASSPPSMPIEHEPLPTV